MIKIILTVIILFGIIMIVGCSENSKVKTAPWSKTQIERMEMREVESVPIFIAEF